MTFVLGMIFIIIPLCIGSGLKILFGKGKNSICLVYISGSLGMFLISGVCQFVTIMGDFSFGWYAKLLGITILIASVIGAILGIVTKKQNAVEPMEIKKTALPVFAFLAAGIFLILCTRTDNVGDFTLETVNTTLETDSIYEFNSFTGRQIEEGMPIRQKILTPPFLYAAVCSLLSLPAQRVVYLYIPIWLLLTVICIFILWAKELSSTPDEQRLFLWFCAVLTVFAGYGVSSWGYQMWTRGYTGNAWVAAVVVPFVVYACRKRMYMAVIAACMAEVFMAWTTYGIGFGMITAGVCCGISFIQWIKNRRKKRCM